EPVRFEPAVRGLLDAGHAAFVEISAHPVLTAAVQETAEAAERTAVVAGTLRREHDGPRQLLTNLAVLHTTGTDVDWPRYFTGVTGHADLPTYAFQRTRYWLTPSGPSAGELAGAGLTTAGHPLLGAAVDLADDGGLVLTGRLAADPAAWTADHVVLGTTLLPGAVLAELALAAGDRVGCGTLDELVLGAPLALPERGALHLQIRVGRAETDHRRTVSVHARPEDGEAPWTRHAEGVLAPADTAPGTPLTEWPPAGAEPVDVSALYDTLADRGLDYGPVFRGVRAAWRHGDDLLAEVELPANTDESGFLLHPALLDAALHPIGLGGLVGDGGLPFAWQGLRVHAVGARTARVRLTPLGNETVAVDLADGTGAPLATVGSLRLRAVTAEQVAAARTPTDPVLHLDWLPVAATAPADDTAVELLHLDAPRGPDAGPEAVRQAVRTALTAIQEWIAADRPERLVVVTGDTDLAGAAVGGLLRSAQAEHPGRFGHVVLDGHPDSERALPAAAALTDEPWVAVRAGETYVPRLARTGVQA
ncbi:polyketide synthase dehydratase domain-containing protein, partial [Streptomyces sp. TRM70350]|uniref:polyketide synthase dehydratase domain-containing protein n=1 Tax=Streptomyces sp. TRM70350 TaxID=2856165 RepID=UPI001C446418